MGSAGRGEEKKWVKKDKENEGVHACARGARFYAGGKTCAGQLGVTKAGMTTTTAGGSAQCLDKSVLWRRALRYGQVSLSIWNAIHTHTLTKDK